MSTPDDIRNVVVLGHKGAGKTSLVEAALFVAKVTPKLGKTGDRASGSRRVAEERRPRDDPGSATGQPRWNGKKVSLVDTPGEASFLADTRLALGACDAAVVS